MKKCALFAIVAESMTKRHLRMNPLLYVPGLIVAFLLSSVVKSQHSRVRTGGEGMIGLPGTASEKFLKRNGHYEGQVAVRGEIWRATSSQPIISNQEIKVEDRQGLTVIVSGNQTEVEST